MYNYERCDGLVKRYEADGRTISMYHENGLWVVKVDYGDNYQPSRLAFENRVDAEIRYNSGRETYWEVDDEGDWHCSNCKAIVEADEQGRHNWFYCYHCGKKMYNPYYAK